MLEFPDYSGNTMFNTLGNIAINPRAGLLFLDFEGGATLQLTGEAWIDWTRDEPRGSRGPSAWWSSGSRRPSRPEAPSRGAGGSRAILRSTPRGVPKGRQRGAEDGPAGLGRHTRAEGLTRWGKDSQSSTSSPPLDDRPSRTTVFGRSPRPGRHPKGRPIRARASVTQRERRTKACSLG